MTPLHYPIAYAIKKYSKRIAFPGLIVGAVVPDIEVPILVLFFPNLPDHLLLHSLVGALTIGLVIAVLVTRFLYTPIIAGMFKVDRQHLSELCKITPIMVSSCAIGILSHLLVDVLVHPFNPFLWPWMDPFALPGPLVVLLGNGNLVTGFVYASAVCNVVLIPAWIIILYINRGKNLWSRIWIDPIPNRSEGEEPFL